jgi:hypothetical protein
LWWPGFGIAGTVSSFGVLPRLGLRIAETDFLAALLATIRAAVVGKVRFVRKYLFLLSQQLQLGIVLS